MTPVGSPALRSPLPRPGGAAAGAILWVSCGPACVVSIRAVGHGGTSRRPGLAGRFRADRQETTMFAPLPRRGTHPRLTALRAGARLRRLAAVLAAATCALLASAVTIPTAFALLPPAPGGQFGTTRPAPVPATTAPRGHRRRYGGLADHLDRARRRPDRGRRSRALRPGTGRPPGRLRNHRLTPFRPARKDTGRAPGSRPGSWRGLADQRAADAGDKHQPSVLPVPSRTVQSSFTATASWSARRSDPGPRGTADCL